MKNKFSIILLLSLLWPWNNVSRAQGGFRSRFCLPNSNNNLSKAIFEISPGNYFGAGFSYDSINGSNVSKLTTMGLNSTGQLQWVKKYGKPKFTYLGNNFIRRSYYKQNAFIYYTGCVRDSNNAQIGVLIKFDQNGDTLWQRIYRDPNVDVIPQMVTGSVDGGFLITGWFQDWVNNTQPCMLIKTDANGHELWRKQIHKLNPDVFSGNNIIQDSATKKIVVTGYQYIGGTNVYDLEIVTDSLGNGPSINNFTGDGGFISDAIQTKDKKILVVGYLFNSLVIIGGGKSIQSYIAKFDVNNPTVPIWAKSFDQPTTENYFNCVREMPNGNILVGGSIDTLAKHNIMPNTYVRMTVFDSGGNLKFNRYYDYKISDSTQYNDLEMESLEIPGDGSWIASVRLANFQLPNPFFFIKYDSTGCDSSAAHCATLNLVGLLKNGMGNAGLCMWPNPADDVLRLQLIDKSLQTSSCRLLIADYLGRVVIEEELKFTNQNAEISIKQLPAGLYLLKLRQGSTTISSQKLVVEH